MRLLLFVVMVATTLFASAQAKNAGVPPFKMLQTNGHFFEAKDLDKTKPVVLIYFAPDCPHCQVLLDGVFKNYAAFKKTQVVLVTFKPVSELQVFERERNTAQYTNLHSGTEGTTYYLRYYYNLSTTPFVAVFNKNQMLCSFRSTDTPIADVLQCVKKLK